MASYLFLRNLRIACNLLLLELFVFYLLSTNFISTLFSLLLLLVLLTISFDSLCNAPAEAVAIELIEVGTRVAVTLGWVLAPEEICCSCMGDASRIVVVFVKLFDSVSCLMVLLLVLVMLSSCMGVRVCIWFEADVNVVAVLVAGFMISCRLLKACGMVARVAAAVLAVAEDEGDRSAPPRSSSFKN